MRRRTVSKKVQVELGQYWEDALHSLKGPAACHRFRKYRGRIGAIELEPIQENPQRPASLASWKPMKTQSFLIRTTGEYHLPYHHLYCEKNPYLDPTYRPTLSGVLKDAA